MNAHTSSDDSDVVRVTRRAFSRTAAAGCAATSLAPFSISSSTEVAGQGTERTLVVSLQDETSVAIKGPHRFLQIAGRTGLQVTSLHTKAVLKTDLHREPQGTLTFWFSPLEDLTFAPSNQSNSKVTFDFPYLSDVFPGRALGQARFGIWFTVDYPAILAKFAGGGVWEKLDSGLAPFVYAEKAVLREGYWYQIALTWDRSAKRLAIYLNGMMVGHNLRAENFETAAEQLYLGNPMMAMADLHIENRALGQTAIDAGYQATRPRANQLPDAELRSMLQPAFLAPLDLRRDDSWKTAFECPFSRTKDLDDWIRQGPGAKFLADFRMATTREGLLLKTPDKIDSETRMYLWSQRRFEGDQWIEVDFRLESPAGLALLVACASGMQREDFVADHGVPNTGAMTTILRDVRCYHWEFVRRVEAMRTDVETQYVAKNPFGRRLHSACIPRLEQNRWYRLRFIKAGRRLHGSLDGQTVFDLSDNPFDNNGPVYNFGRIGLRQMYHTALRYRDLVVYQRGPRILPQTGDSERGEL